MPLLVDTSKHTTESLLACFPAARRELDAAGGLVVETANFMTDLMLGIEFGMESGLSFPVPRDARTPLPLQYKRVLEYSSRYGIR